MVCFARTSISFFNQKRLWRTGAEFGKTSNSLHGTSSSTLSLIRGRSFSSKSIHYSLLEGWIFSLFPTENFIAGKDFPKKLGYRNGTHEPLKPSCIFLKRYLLDLQLSLPVLAKAVSLQAVPFLSLWIIISISIVSSVQILVPMLSSSCQLDTYHSVRLPASNISFFFRESFQHFLI